MHQSHFGQDPPYFAACVTARINDINCPLTHCPIPCGGSNLAFLEPHRHTASDIAARCVEHLERNHNQTNASQRHAQQQLAKLVDRHTNPDMRSWLSKSTLTEYMELFARLFFGEDMISYVRVKMEGGPDDEDRLPDMIGHISWDRTILAPYVQIWLSRLVKLNGEAEGVRRRANILSTLLHEMTHAVFWIYGCNGFECKTNENVWETTGFTGHGPSWVTVFKALRKKLYQMEDLEFIKEEGQAGLGLLRAINLEMEVAGQYGWDWHPDLVRQANEEEILNGEHNGRQT